MSWFTQMSKAAKAAYIITAIFVVMMTFGGFVASEVVGSVPTAEWQLRLIGVSLILCAVDAACINWVRWVLGTLTPLAALMCLFLQFPIQLLAKWMQDIVPFYKKSWADISPSLLYGAIGCLLAYLCVLFAVSVFFGEKSLPPEPQEAPEQ